MTCKVCSYINEAYAERCASCNSLLNEKASSVTKSTKTDQISPIDAALKDIKKAWGAGVISGILTLGVTLYVLSGNEYLSFDIFSLTDVVLTFGLAFGIYKKNRACAVIMLIYFLLSKYLIFTESGSLSGLPLSMVFIYCYYRGVVGTFNHHKLKNA